MPSFRYRCEQLLSNPGTDNPVGSHHFGNMNTLIKNDGGIAGRQAIVPANPLRQFGDRRLHRTFEFSGNTDRDELVGRLDTRTADAPSANHSHGELDFQWRFYPCATDFSVTLGRVTVSNVSRAPRT